MSYIGVCVSEHTGGHTIGGKPGFMSGRIAVADQFELLIDISKYMAEDHLASSRDWKHRPLLLMTITP